MAHYLLKKRIMLQMQQQQQQQQQQLKVQLEESPSAGKQVTNNEINRPVKVMVENNDNTNTSNETSVIDKLVKAQTENVELPKWGRTEDVVRVDSLEHTDQSCTDEVLNLTTGTNSSSVDNSQKEETTKAKTLHENLTCISSPVDVLSDASLRSIHPSLYAVDRRPAKTEADFLKQEREKEKLISRILSIVRASMNNSLQNIELNDTAMLKQCMNVLSNPLNGFGNIGMMNFPTIDQSQMGFGEISTSLSGTKMSGSVSTPRYAPLMSETNIFRGQLDVAQLATSSPNVSKILQQTTKPSEMRMSNGRGDFELLNRHSTTGYSGPVPTATITSKSHVESVHHSYKTEFEPKPFPFGAMTSFEGTSGDHKPYGTQPQENITKVHDRDDGSNHQATEMSNHSDDRDWHVMRTTKYESFPIAEHDRPNAQLSVADDRESPRSRSFHRDQDNATPPSRSGSENSPITSPMVSGSGQEHRPYVQFNGNRPESTAKLPASTITSSENHPTAFSQSDRYSASQQFMLMGSADRLSAERELVSTQQSAVISSSSLPDNIAATRRRRLMTDPTLDGFPVTSSGRNKGLGKGNEPKFDCQVCSDVAAGFHCGAYVCEACKKFYLRCLKNDSNLLTCPKSQHCEINKENRSHCQFCRYQKCITLGMYRPGREYDKNLKVNFKAIPCKVCGACSSGFHFGAITCEGCKGFFRRMLKENLHQKFTCSSGNACDITSASRTFCKACRFNKCLKIGMKLEGTRLGRQSNSIKRNTLMAYQMQEFDGPPAKLPASTKIKSEPINEDYTRSSEGIKDMDCCIVDDLDDVSLEAIENMEFDASLLEVTDSPKAKDSPEKEANAMKDAPGMPLMRELHSRPLIGVAEQYKTNNLHKRGGGHNDGMQSVRRKVSHSPASNDAIRGAVNSFVAPNHRLESLNNSWNKYAPVLKHHENPDHSSGSNQSSYSQPVFNPHFVNRHMSREDLPQHTESHSGYNITSKHQMDAAGTSSNTHTNSIVAIRSSTNAVSRPKPAGTDIYSDPVRLVTYLVDIYSILDGMKEIPESIKQFKIEVGQPQSIWNYTMQGFVHNSYIMLKFLKAIPGFRCLPQSKQIDLCQETIYPISLLYHSQNFDSRTCQVQFFCYTDEERELLFTSFPNFRGMLNHFVQCGSWLFEMKVDREELAMITVIFVLTATDRAVCDKSFAKYLEDLTLTLMDYCHRKNPSRGGILLAKMAELKRANCEHHEMANLTIQQNPDISFGQLWQEIFTFQ